MGEIICFVKIPKGLRHVLEKGRDFVTLVLERQGANLKREDLRRTMCEKGSEGNSYWYYGPK